MAVRAPQNLLGKVTLSNGLELLGDEIIAEQSGSLAHMEKQAKKALGQLRAFDEAPIPGADRQKLVKGAADAVWAYFVQRELCGFRNNRTVARDLAVPREVMNRLGAR